MSRIEPFNTRTKDGTEVVVRTAEVVDAERVMDLDNHLGGTSEFLVILPGERGVTLEKLQQRIRLYGYRMNVGAGAFGATCSRVDFDLDKSPSLAI